MIDRAYLAQAVALLKAQGLPAQKYDSLGEVFEKEGMISTPLEEKARYIYALSQELEKTIAQMDGVLIARVHLVLSDENRIGQQIQKPSAAVFVKHLPELDPDTISQKIKRIVSHGTPGLNEEDSDSVSVSFVAASVNNIEVKWVDVWGFRMTDSSAVRFKASLKRALSVGLFIGGIGGVILFIRFMRKHRRKMQLSTHGTKT